MAIVSSETPFTLWAVLRKSTTASATGAGAVSELESTVKQIEDELDLRVRGLYDATGIKADADVIIWLHGAKAENLQEGLRRLRRTAMLAPLVPTWNTLGVHREAEFNAKHRPAFVEGKDPAGWLTVYPFVRSHEWYLLGDEERASMLANHGRRGAKFTNVISNTVAAFALGDYEWIIALESDELRELVDLMRNLRYTSARRHTRTETPFYTGRRVSAAELAQALA